MATQKGQSRKKPAKDFKNLRSLPEIQQRSSGPGESIAGVMCLSARIHQKNCHIFLTKVAATLLSGSKKEHSSHMVEVSVEVTCWHFKPWHILKEATEPAGPFGTMPQGPWHPGKGAKPDCVIWLNCGEVRTHASYKRTRIWENFNKWGTKTILLSDEHD